MPQSTGESFITKRIIIGPQDEASVVVQIALDLLSNFDSHQEDECLGRFTSCILQICQCSNMILICHVVGAKLGAYRNTESYPDLFSIYIYIFIAWKQPPDPAVPVHLKANPKYFKPSQTQSPARFQFSVATIVINKCIAFVIDSQSQIVSTNTQTKLRPKGSNFVISARRFAPT